MGGHDSEVAVELFVDKCLNFVLASDFNHEAFIRPLLMMCCHYKVTVTEMIMKI